MPTLSAVVALCALVFPATTMPITTPACAGREMHYSVNKISGDHSWYIPQAAPPRICAAMPKLHSCEKYRPR